MRRSTESLLRTYLGDGPSKRVTAGAMRQGDWFELEAAVLLTDLRGYTASSEQLSPKQLLEHLDRYFGTVVEAVREHGGDVLKIIGDGVLSIFPVDEGGRREASRRAYQAIFTALTRAAQVDGPNFVGCLHAGPVTYGNIGSPDRLDFTVVGPTVNVVSRLEAIAKSMNCPAVCSQEVAALLPAEAGSPLGTFALKGVSDDQTIFKLLAPGEQA
jgi:adenylate cyclase